MIDAEKAAQIEARLAKLLDVRADVLRDYLAGNIRAGGARRTGYKFVRGSHGGSYIRDPQGTDMLPSGHTIPE